MTPKKAANFMLSRFYNGHYNNPIFNFVRCSNEDAKKHPKKVSRLINKSHSDYDKKVKALKKAFWSDMETAFETKTHPKRAKIREMAAEADLDASRDYDEDCASWGDDEVIKKYAKIVEIIRG
jgi:hypothetical protein